MLAAGENGLVYLGYVNSYTPDTTNPTYDNLKIVQRTNTGAVWSLIPSESSFDQGSIYAPRLVLSSQDTLFLAWGWGSQLYQKPAAGSIWQTIPNLESRQIDCQVDLVVDRGGTPRWISSFRQSESPDTSINGDMGTVRLSYEFGDCNPALAWPLFGETTVKPCTSPSRSTPPSNTTTPTARNLPPAWMMIYTTS